MKYKSLFDCDFSKDNSPIDYNASLEDVLKDVVSVDKMGSEIGRSKGLALGASRIVKGILEYKISNPETKDIVGVVNSSLKTASDIYSGESCGKTVDYFKSFLQGSGNEKALNTMVSQPNDDVSWEYSSGNFSSKVVDSFPAFGFDKESLLFLILGNGGIMPGIDVFLRAKDNYNLKDSVAYPVRFSRLKKEDQFPQLDSSELEYLKDQAKDKSVIVFDEDMRSGRTIKKAKDFFRSVLEKPKIIQFTNSHNYKSFLA